MSSNRARLIALITVLLCALLSGCRSFYGSATGVSAPQPVGAVAVAPATPPPGVAATVGPPVAVAPPPVAVAPAPAVVVAPPPTVAPGGPLSRSFSPLAAAQLSLAPQSVVAPVGSDVVLLATVADGSGNPLPNQRVEWMLAPDSAGQFVALGERNRGFSWQTNPRGKVGIDFVVANTASRTVTITRGTPTQIDDVAVQRGQSWVSVTSSTDGTSNVTALAPDIPAWDRRKQTATIYWIDAQFSFPAPAIGAAGSRQLFNTIVTRSSDGSALEGYLVRYVITGGPAAAFAPTGVTEIEVPTDAHGHATVELFQQQPVRGENTMQVEVIRPAGFAGSIDRRLVIGRGSTMMTWTAPDIAVRVTGPAEADVGASATYRLEVQNTGDAPVTQLTLSNRVPPGLRFQNSSVPADTSPSGLTWQLGELAPGLTQAIDVTYEVTRSGNIENCATATTAEGLRAEACALTTANVNLPTLELQVSGPERATVGQRVTFAISITNNTGSDVEDVVIRDTYDEGLVHEVENNPIERDLGTLAAGETRDNLAITFEVTKPGRLCHTVEVSAPGIQSSQAVRCVEAVAAAPQAQPGLSVNKTGPATAKVGDEVLFELTVTNTGDTTLTNLKVTDTYERGLKPIRVSEGYKIEDEQLTWRYDSLRPGESKLLQVEVRCEEAIRACSRATVTANGDLIMADEACLQIEALPPPPMDGTSPPPAVDEQPPVVPDEAPPAEPTPQTPPGTDARPATPPAGEPPTGKALSLQMTDLRDEVSVGRTVIYEVTVTNIRNVTDQNVELVVNLPNGMSAVSVGTVAPSRHTVTGQIVRFNPVAEVRPGEALIYRIPVRANRAGRFVVESKAISGAQQQPLVATEETNIFAEG